MTCFVHTSDWQLGAAFGQIPGDKGARLRGQRLEAIDRIRKMAEEVSAEFVLIAGDLFDAHTIQNEVVTQACERIGRFPMQVYAIPGNHDFASAPESVYARERFKHRKPENLHILKETVPVQVPGTSAVILPCPLLHRHTVSDPTGWLQADTGRMGADIIRIGLAHGSVVNFGPEDGGTMANLIDPAVVERAELDYLALGDWHGVKKIGDRAWYSGTPEPDRFRDGAPGSVLVVRIDRPGDVPQVEAREVAACQWLRHLAGLYGEQDVALLERWFGELPHPERTLVRLELDGVLGMAAHDHLDRLLETQEELLLCLRRRGGGVRLQPSDAEIEAMAGAGLTGKVVQRLRALAEREGEEGEHAAMAIQALYHMQQGPEQGDTP